MPTVIRSNERPTSVAWRAEDVNAAPGRLAWRRIADSARFCAVGSRCCPAFSHGIVILVEGRLRVPRVRLGDVSVMQATRRISTPSVAGVGERDAPAFGRRC